MINVTNKDLCCGCEACIQKCPKQCISKIIDNEGYVYPLVNKDICIDCNLCVKVCPILNDYEIRKPLFVYAAKNKDEKIRRNSSSGGLFFEIAKNVIQQNGVVFGAKFDQNWNVVHDYTENVKGLYEFQGSKYVQSNINGAYRKVETFLKANRLVLFSGTPCQISALLHFLRKEYQNLLTLDVVCHGVPSNKVWKKFLEEELGDNIKKINSISFRNKDGGWLKYKMKIIFKKNISSCISASGEIQEYSKYHRQTSFFKGFLTQYFLRPSCYNCKFRSGKSGSDITLADFWGFEEFSNKWNDDKGVSLVLVNTSKGKFMIEECNVDLFASSYENAIKGNKSIIEDPNLPLGREKVYNRLNKGICISDALRFGRIEFFIIKVVHKLKEILCV